MEGFPKRTENVESGKDVISRINKGQREIA